MSILRPNFVTSALGALREKAMQAADQGEPGKTPAEDLKFDVPRETPTRRVPSGIQSNPIQAHVYAGPRCEHVGNGSGAPIR